MVPSTWRSSWDLGETFGSNKNLANTLTSLANNSGVRIMCIYYICYICIKCVWYINLYVWRFLEYIVNPNNWLFCGVKFIVKSLKITKYNMHVFHPTPKSPSISWQFHYVLRKLKNCNLSKDTGKKKNTSKSPWVFFKRDASKDLFLMG